MQKRIYISGTAAVLAIASMAIAIPAFAQTNTTGNAPAWSQNKENGQGMMRGKGMGMMRPGVVGKVSAVSGTTLTLSGRQGFGSTTAATTFSVDASNATVFKNNATSTLSSIAVGDMVSVQGTVSGTSVTATTIRDGVMGMRGQGGQGKMGPNGMGTSSPFTGNGQPVLAGNVSSINGSTIAITNKSNVSYSIDASNAKIVQGQNIVALSNISVGDSVVVQGTVNGTSVTASSIIDQKNSGNSNSNQPKKGFFGSIGSFFSHLFGF